MNLTEAKTITGGISFPSKLKGTAAASALHPGACVTGALLSQSDNSVCFNCFGKKGRFTFPSVQQSLWRKTEIVKNLNVNKRPIEYDEWIKAWAGLINHYSPRYFRHFMVGDIQSLNHYYALRAIMNDTPSTRHWMPSLDWWKFAHDEKPPRNAFVRWTWPRINQNVRNGHHDKPLKAIVVTNRDHVPKGYFPCPATFTSLKTCKANSCTACWTNANIAYKEH